MGISIYYNAKRKYPLTEEENKFVNDVINKYNKEKKLKINEDIFVDDFCVYEYDKDEPETIFSGATGLPMSTLNPMLTVTDAEQLFFAACLYWAKCLTEIKDIVKDAEWSVNIDDTYLIWDEKEGWQLPNE